MNCDFKEYPFDHVFGRDFGPFTSMVNSHKNSSVANITLTSNFVNNPAATLCLLSI